MPATSASSLIQLVSSAAFRGLLVAPVDHFEERQRQDSSPTPTYLIESLNRFKWLEDIEQDIVPDLTALDLRSPHSQCTANVRDEIEQITGIKDDLMKSVFTVQDLIQVSFQSRPTADCVVADILLGHGYTDFQGQGYLGTGCYWFHALFYEQLGLQMLHKL